MKKIIILLLLILVINSVFYAQVPELLINEVMTSNQTTIKDRRNKYYDWVEIYNPGTDAINMAEMYFSDDKNNPKKIRISGASPGHTTVQAKSVKMFWFSKKPENGPSHIDLKLGSTEEYLSLYDTSGTILIDDVLLQNQRIDVSYGRKPDGGEKYYFFAKPTPKAGNVTKAYSGFTPKVESDVKGGFYDSSVKVKLSSKDPSQIYYSLDGTTPDDSTGIKYSGPVTINKTCILKATIIKPDYIVADVCTESFFINEDYTLPVVSIATDDYKMFTSTDPKNNIRKERLANIEYFDEGKRLVFSVNAGIRLVGKAIRNYPQKSIAVRLRGSYGKSKIRYKLFDDKEETDYYAFLLRNSGNDWSGTMLKDALMHSLVNGYTSIDCQGYRPVIVYINGDYWGIHNLREKINKYYIKSNYPEIDIDKIDLVEWNSRPIQGSDSLYKKLESFADNNDLSIPQNYYTVLNMVDIESFIDYNIAEIFYANCDWPMANMKYWRPQTEDGKWRWIMFDTDLGWDKNKRYCPDKGHHNTLLYALGINNCHLPHLEKSLIQSTVVLRKLIDNEDFRQRFVNRFSDLTNTIFTPGNILASINELKGGIDLEMPKHIERWSSSKKGIKNIGHWVTNIATMKMFASERSDTTRMFFDERFELGGNGLLELNIEGNTGGRIQVNSIIPDNYPWQGVYFRKSKVKITAIPEKGSSFIKWSDGIDTPDRIIELSQDLNLTAIFK